jgi:hypothetical protein
MWTLNLMQADGPQQIKTKHFVLAIDSAGQTPVMPEMKDRVRKGGAMLKSTTWTPLADLVCTTKGNFQRNCCPLGRIQELGLIPRQKGRGGWNGQYR